MFAPSCSNPRSRSRRTKRMQRNATNAIVASTLRRVSLSLSSSRTFSSVRDRARLMDSKVFHRRRDNYMPTSTPRVNWPSCTKHCNTIISRDPHFFSLSFFFFARRFPRFRKKVVSERLQLENVRYYVDFFLTHHRLFQKLFSNFITRG